MKKSLLNVMGAIGICVLASCGSDDKAAQQQNGQVVPSYVVTDIANYIKGSQKQELFIRGLREKQKRGTLSPDLIKELESIRDYETKTEFETPRGKKIMSPDYALRFAQDSNMTKIKVPFYVFRKQNGDTIIDSIIKANKSNKDAATIDNNERNLRALMGVGLGIRNYPEYEHFMTEVERMPNAEMYSNEDDRKNAKALAGQVDTFKTNLEWARRVDASYQSALAMNDDFTPFYKTLDSVKTPEVAREAMVNLRDLSGRYNGYPPQSQKFNEAMTHLKAVIENKNIKPKITYVPRNDDDDEGSEFDF